MRKGLIGFFAGIFGGYDTFMRAYPVPVPGEKRTDDLFQWMTPPAG
jgi:hypothetical protein